MNRLGIGNHDKEADLGLFDTDVDVYIRHFGTVAFSHGAPNDNRVTLRL